MDGLITTEYGNGIMTMHYKDYIHYCRMTDNTPCQGVATEHMIVYVYSGELELMTSGRTYHLRKGDAYIIRRNHLCRKSPRVLPGGEPFEGIFYYLKVPMLRRTMSQNNITLRSTETYTRKSPYLPLPRHPFLENLFDALVSYFRTGEFPGEKLMDLKTQETILTLIEISPELRPLLFNFALPVKADLHDFMEQYYLQDLDLKGLAHYAGRSLAAFKNDFRETYHTSPGRWIVSRRLTEAHRLIGKEGKRPVDVYQETGFKTLSHFSRAFKEKYGITPSMFARETAK